MKFAVGYQQPKEGEAFSSVVYDYRENIAEVFFPWVHMPSGRAALGNEQGIVHLHAKEMLLEELAHIRELKIKLDLLLNANCYGEWAISARFESKIAGILVYLNDYGLLPEIITTTSPFVAQIVKKHWPGIEIRASVNMRIGSTLAMEYLGEFFDSFYIRRDVQRDMARVREIKSHCDARGKKLLMLANSGCLRNCPSQTFHDNLLAHSLKADEITRYPDFEPHLCRQMYRDWKRYEEILRSTWIRPEDLDEYKDLFPVVKLATRQHTFPRMVIGAYVSHLFDGNLLDLLEPGFSSFFAPFIIENKRFPEIWKETARGCASNCVHCGKCETVLKEVLVKL